MSDDVKLGLFVEGDIREEGGVFNWYNFDVFYFDVILVEEIIGKL